MTGKLGVRPFTMLFKGNEYQEAFCVACLDGSKETPMHVLVECTSYENIRRRSKNKMFVSRPHTMSTKKMFFIALGFVKEVKKDYGERIEREDLLKERQEQAKEALVTSREIWKKRMEIVTAYHVEEKRAYVERLAEERRKEIHKELRERIRKDTDSREEENNSSDLSEAELIDILRNLERRQHVEEQAEQGEEDDDAEQEDQQHQPRRNFARDALENLSEEEDVPDNASDDSWLEHLLN